MQSIKYIILDLTLWYYTSIKLNENTFVLVVTALLFWSIGYAKWGSNSIKGNMLHLLLAALGGMDGIVVAVSVANNK